MTTPRLPDFLMLGQGKAGSTLIYNTLAANPLIGLSDPKELHFFNAHYDKGSAWYANHFAHVPDQVKRVGEISPSYLMKPHLTRLTQLLGRDLKVFFVLRRPIERLYARYLQNICASQKIGGFEDSARRLPRLLEKQLTALRYLYDTFETQNILPLFFEHDVATDSPTFETKILKHLDLPKADYRPHTRINKTVMPRYIHTGDAGQVMFHGGQRYILPKHSLIFCAQPRNSWVQKDPSHTARMQAVLRQSTWSGAVSVTEYSHLLETYVLPMADRLETEFGFDLSHWRTTPRQLLYAPAPPPEMFRRERILGTP